MRHTFITEEVGTIEEDREREKGERVAASNHHIPLHTNSTYTKYKQNTKNVLFLLVSR